MLSTSIEKGGFPDREAVLLPPMLFPPIAYYALMNNARSFAFDTELRYNKSDKGTHRFTIADTRGLLRLTVPVSHSDITRTWNDVTISDHGRWWETMPVALESAYGRTPFFEFYIDRLMPVFSPEPITVIEFCAKADRIVRSILDIPDKPFNTGVENCKYSPAFFDNNFDLPEYWQVRRDTLGFIPGLSVLDLIFNLGPEAQLYLDRLSTSDVENS